MAVKTLYYYFPNAISGNLCDEIIEKGEKILQENKSKGLSTLGITGGRKEKSVDSEKSVPLNDKLISQVGEDYYMRDSEISWFDERWLYDILQNYLRIANEKAGWNYEWDYSQPVQFTKYGLNQFYGWHNDGDGCHLSAYKRYIQGVSPVDKFGDIPQDYSTNENFIGKVRKISMTVNLTDSKDYEGGDLKFDFGPHSKNQYHTCEEIRPKGSIIVFPSYVYHQVTPVTKGTRYSLVMWSTGKPFK